MTQLQPTSHIRASMEKAAMPSIIVVKATFDEEAEVWITASPDVPGLHLEADTLEALREKLPGALADLLEPADDDEGDDRVEIPVELIAHASARVRLRPSA